jgi:chitinase
MPLPIDAASRVSEEMSSLLESLVNNPDLDLPVTLGVVRNKLKLALAGLGLEPDRHAFGNEQSLYAEIEALIEEYGEDAPALDFLAVKASDALSDLIEALLDDFEDEDVAATLGRVREAIVDGLAARLAGDGVIGDDEEQTLLAEVDALIERYGEDTLAEDVLGFD